MLPDISLLVLCGHFLVYVVILIIPSIFCITKSIQKIEKHNRTKDDDPQQNDIDLDGNLTDVDMFYDTKVNLELQKTKYSNQDHEGMDFMINGQISEPITPTKSSNDSTTMTTIPVLPEVIVEVNEDDISNDIENVEDD